MHLHTTYNSQLPTIHLSSASASLPPCAKGAEEDDVGCSQSSGRHLRPVHNCLATKILHLLHDFAVPLAASVDATTVSFRFASASHNRGLCDPHFLNIGAIMIFRIRTTDPGVPTARPWRSVVLPDARIATWNPGPNYFLLAHWQVLCLTWNEHGHVVTWDGLNLYCGREGCRLQCRLPSSESCRVAIYLYDAGLTRLVLNPRTEGFLAGKR